MKREEIRRASKEKNGREKIEGRDIFNRMRLLLCSFYVDQILTYETVMCFRVRGSVLFIDLLTNCFSFGGDGGRADNRPTPREAAGSNKQKPAV